MPKRTTKKADGAAAKIARGAIVKIDPALERRWNALYGIVHTAQREGAIEFDRLWETVGEIVDRELYLLGGFKDARDFFARELGENERNAYRFIRVARFASPTDEAKYGVTKLDAALSFIEAKIGAPLAHPPLPIAFDKLRFPGKTGTFAVCHAWQSVCHAWQTRLALRRNRSQRTSSSWAIGSPSRTGRFIAHRPRIARSTTGLRRPSAILLATRRRLRRRLPPLCSR